MLQIPETIGRCAQLRRLVLSQNYVAGVIPPQLGMLKSLQVVDFSGNAFTGGLPPEIGDMVGLNTLILSYNQLGGFDEDGVPYRTNAQHLTYCIDFRALGLAFNNFEEEETQALVEIMKKYFGGFVSVTV
jgi:hypothetical protein